jgi:uncharacterized protein involved in type VI secretion and phage assembly
VKYPALGDGVESWWARMAAPGAGKDRGQLMLPIVGDEVLVAFEHGDVQRPYVLGSLWNGHDEPGDLAHTDGSYALHTEAEYHLEADKKIEIAGQDTLKLQSAGDLTIKTDGSITQTATGQVEISGQSITIKGSSISIEGTTVKVSGMVQLG